MDTTSTAYRLPTNAATDAAAPRWAWPQKVYRMQRTG
jgi:hypothetical protein